ncbi:MAG: 50S ribosomal protein L19 [Planctomycetaceae bacterium]|nr:50S ribosomal protein L19 [Planctomycetaceae bacterium]
MGGFAYDLERKQIKKSDIPVFGVGDTVDVHIKIAEGEKERIQIFSGVVLARKHQGLRETFTVRRIVSGEGVEQVFPLHSPRLAKIEVQRRGNVRRAKLYYLRSRVGKATRIEEDLKRSREAVVDSHRSTTAPAKAPAAAEAAPAEAEPVAAGAKA